MLTTRSHEIKTALINATELCMLIIKLSHNAGPASSSSILWLYVRAGLCNCLLTQLKAKLTHPVYQIVYQQPKNRWAHVFN